MPNSALLLSAILAYVLATFLVFRNSANKDDRALTLSFVFAAVAWALHSSYAYILSEIGNNLNFSLSSMITLVSAMLIAVFLLACIGMPIKRLGILVYPLTVASLAFAYFWSSDPSYLSSATSEIGRTSPAFKAHILISLLSYALLTIAAIQALLYAYLESKIKSRTSPALLAALPPLETMEQLLFRLVGVGFILLSFTLISGALFSQEIFGQPFEFKHHTVLAVLGWLVFGTLLYKRFAQGLRGSKAVMWTIGGFLLIQLGYFGTKIISESLNLQ